jgi:putative Mg2+ transporter-C (MgtC) family protein
VLNLLSFVRELDMLGVLCRLLAAVICGGVVGLEREYKRRPAGFRTHILICVGASLTTLTSQFVLIRLGQFTDPARLGAQVIAGIGFIGAGAIIVTKNRQVKGLTTAAGLWVAAIVGLCCGAGYVEAALVVTAIILVAELFLSRLEYWLTSKSRTINIYVEFSQRDNLEDIIDCIRRHKITLVDMQVTKNGVGTVRKPCAMFSLQLNRSISHDHLMTAVSEIRGVISVEEL